MRAVRRRTDPCTADLCRGPVRDRSDRHECGTASAPCAFVARLRLAYRSAGDRRDSARRLPHQDCRHARCGMSGKIMQPSGNSVPMLTSAPALRGRVVEARGVVARVVGVSLRIGEKVRLVRPDTFEAQYGEVVGFAHDGALVMPLAGLAGLSDITEVQGCGSTWN